MWGILLEEDSQNSTVTNSLPGAIPAWFDHLVGGGKAGFSFLRLAILETRGNAALLTGSRCRLAITPALGLDLHRQIAMNTAPVPAQFSDLGAALSTSDSFFKHDVLMAEMMSITQR